VSTGTSFISCCLTALRDEQIMAVRLCCADMLISNGQQSIKRNILAKRKANDSAVLDIDAVMFISAER